MLTTRNPIILGDPMLQLDSGTTRLPGLWGMVTISWEMLLSQEYTTSRGLDITRSRDTNLYTISLDDMLKTSLIPKDGLSRGIPRLKFHKDHLCSACALGKSKKSSHQPKDEDTNQEKLYPLHMDLCGTMRVASINGKSSGPGLHSMTPATSSSGLVSNPVSQQPFQEAVAPRAMVLADSPVLTSIDQDAPSTSTSSTQEQEHSPNIS
ncbi:hypothetical protein Tco_0819538 [Tanacetum coccineum]|uniref:GAG-pre-integrase domain-containing protein n=1 Tax=Tanacetum coccineum TaxID=301880 RepID=A0ABQ5A8L9_9ASTR